MQSDCENGEDVVLLSVSGGLFYQPFIIVANTHKLASAFVINFD